MVGYKVQTAVDTKYHLIVAHVLTNVGHDKYQLANMSNLAQRAMGKTDIVAVADLGYFSDKTIFECEQQGAILLVLKPSTSNNRARRLFDKRDFIYIEQSNEHVCPAGQQTPRRYKTVEDGQVIDKYWFSFCSTCDLTAKCTNGDNRRITCWEHEKAIEHIQQQLAARPDRVIMRR
jgi:hypothetical protein